MMIRKCTHCGTKNRIPPQYLASRGKCGQCKNVLEPVSEPLDVNQLQFNEIITAAKVPVLVDFWASWCGPCRMAAPQVAAAARALAGKAVVLKVDTEQEQQLAVQYNIRSIPNFAVFKNGALRWQQAGLLQQRELEKVVEQWL